MSLSVPQYVAPQFATPIQTNAWAGVMHVDFRDLSGYVMMVINPDAAAADAGLPPLDTFSVGMGQAVQPGNVVVLKSLAEWLADPVVGPAFQTIRQAIYAALPAHPRLAGATEVP